MSTAATKLAIDADSLAYRLGPDCVTDNFYSDFEASGEDTSDDDEGFVGESPDFKITEDLGNGNKVETSPELARIALSHMIKDIVENTGITDYTLHVSPGHLVNKALEARRAQDLTADEFAHLEELEAIAKHTNFRYEVANDLEHAYKHNRSNLAPPAGVISTMYSMLFDYGAVLAYGCEADDVVCALAKHKGYMIAALDKDVVNQTAGKVWNYGKAEWAKTSVEDARFYKYLQAICGDPGDGYKGVPRVGKKKAEAYIDPSMSEVELYKNTLRCYEEHGMCLQECLATLRLADMHQLQFIGDTEEYFIELYMEPEE